VGVQQFHQPLVVRHPPVVSHAEPGNPELLGDPPAGRAVADHHGGVGADVPVPNGAQQRQRRLGAIGGADGQPRSTRAFFGRPDTHRQVLQTADFGERFAELRQVVGWQMDPQQHGEQRQLVVIVHLDLGDVRPLTRYMVNDGIGESHVVGAHGRNHDMHAGHLTPCLELPQRGWSPRPPSATLTPPPKQRLTDCGRRVLWRVF